MRLFTPLLTYSIISISPAVRQLHGGEFHSFPGIHTTGRPDTAPQHPHRRPGATNIGRHVCQIQNEETMGPALKCNETNAETAEVCTWIQDLCRFHSPRHRCVGDVDHAILLSECFVDIVDVTESGIPTCVKDLCWLSVQLSTPLSRWCIRNCRRMSCQRSCFEVRTEH